MIRSVHLDVTMETMTTGMDAQRTALLRIQRIAQVVQPQLLTDAMMRAQSAETALLILGKTATMALLTIQRVERTANLRLGRLASQARLAECVGTVLSTEARLIQSSAMTATPSQVTGVTRTAT